MYRNDRVAFLDIGGPLRDSSDSMGEALKTAARERGHYINLNNRLLWQLWSAKGPRLEGGAGDYRAWFRAAQAIEYDSINLGLTADELCTQLLESEDPTDTVQAVIEEYEGVTPEHMYGPVGDRAYDLFGSDERIKALSRANEGAVPAVKELYHACVLMGVVTSAPQGNTSSWLDQAVKEPLVRGLRIPGDAVLFHPDLIRYGKADKRDHLHGSVVTATEILGAEPRRAWYIADTNDDITDSAATNRRLAEEGRRSRITVAMVRNGMGTPSMWARALSESGFVRGRDYLEFPTSLEAARHIIQEQLGR